MMREILILDTETSGLDSAKDHLIEVGLVRWSVEHRTTLASLSWLVQAPENPAQAINGIPPAILVHGQRPEWVRGVVAEWASAADAIAAHNDFDRQWFPELGKPWIDTAWDIDWPRALNAESRKVHALCLAHGLAVLDAHRALPDCQLLARLLERVAELGHDVGLLLDRAMRPKVKIVSLAPFEQKDVVKQHGFRWSPEERLWWRMMPPEDVAALPFRTAPGSLPSASPKKDTKTKSMRAAAGPASSPAPSPDPSTGPAAAAPSAKGERRAAGAEERPEIASAPATSSPSAAEPPFTVADLPPAPAEPMTMVGGKVVADEVKAYLSVVATMDQYRLQRRRMEVLRADEKQWLVPDLVAALIQVIQKGSDADVDAAYQVIGQIRAVKMLKPAEEAKANAAHHARKAAP